MSRSTPRRGSASTDGSNSAGRQRAEEARDHARLGEPLRHERAWQVRPRLETSIAAHGTPATSEFHTAPPPRRYRRRRSSCPGRPAGRAARRTSPRMSRDLVRAVDADEPAGLAVAARVVREDDVRARRGGPSTARARSCPRRDRHRARGRGSARANRRPGACRRGGQSVAASGVASNEAIVTSCFENPTRQAGEREKASAAATSRSMSDHDAEG